MTLFFVSFSDLTANNRSIGARGSSLPSPYHHTTSFGSGPNASPTTLLTATPLPIASTNGSTTGTNSPANNSDTGSFDASEMDGGQSYCNICNHEIDEGESAISITVAGIVHSRHEQAVDFFFFFLFFCLLCFFFFFFFLCLKSSF
jgi:hypothetical protein